MTSTFESDHDQIERPVQSPPKTLSERPGRLRGETRITIQTRQAQTLITGRRKSEDVEPIVGLSDFGRRMGLVWLAAQADDPYADWFLLKIEDSIVESKAYLGNKKSSLGKILTAMEGVQIETAYSIDPIHVPLAFPNPYGYRGAYLVLNYDELARMVFTAQHTALMHRNTAAKILDSGGRLLRRTFLLAMEWKFMGVTREDLRQMNQNAQRAKDAYLPKYGECPIEIVNGEKRAETSPVIREKPAPSRRNVNPEDAAPEKDETVVPDNQEQAEEQGDDATVFLAEVDRAPEILESESTG